jgi:hypothetical protein
MARARSGRAPIPLDFNFVDIEKIQCSPADFIEPANAKLIGAWAVQMEIIQANGSPRYLDKAIDNDLMAFDFDDKFGRRFVEFIVDYLDHAVARSRA